MFQALLADHQAAQVIMTLSICTVEAAYYDHFGTRAF